MSDYSTSRWTVPCAGGSMRVKRGTGRTVCGAPGMGTCTVAERAPKEMSNRNADQGPIRAAWCVQGGFQGRCTEDVSQAGERVPPGRQPRRLRGRRALQGDPASLRDTIELREEAKPRRKVPCLFLEERRRVPRRGWWEAQEQKRLPGQLRRPFRQVGRPVRQPQRVRMGTSR